MPCFHVVMSSQSFSQLIAFSHSSNVCLKVDLPWNLSFCRCSGHSGLGRDPDRVVCLCSCKIPVLCGAQPVDSDARLELPGDAHQDAHALVAEPPTDISSTRAHVEGGPDLTVFMIARWTPVTILRELWKDGFIFLLTGLRGYMAGLGPQVRLWVEIEGKRAWAWGSVFIGVKSRGGGGAS